MPSDSEKDFVGQEHVNTGAGKFNEIQFLVWQQIAKLATSMPVKVVAQRGGGMDVVGFVDVEPLVQQLTGAGKPVDHGVITNVPYIRLQGGANAVIIDPAKGDIGMACFASRDISSVKRSRKKAAPGSRRQYDLSDAMYVGGLLNAAPTQYIHFAADGLKLVSPTKIRLEAPAVEIIGALTNNGVNMGSTHVHDDPQGGSVGGPH